MAPLTRRQKKALAAAHPPPVAVIHPAEPVIDPTDRISRLPPEIQAEILSFLPAQAAVQTCVLARTWRNVWKFTRRLLISAGKPMKEHQEFVESLLRVRLDGPEVVPLDACEIWFDPCDDEFYDDDSREPRDPILEVEEESIINRWIRRVLERQIQMLRIDIQAHGYVDAYLQMGDIPLLVSRHLTRLELTGVWFVCPCLNLDGCPALEHLEINECMLLGLKKIISLSLKRLVITSCDSNEYVKRIKICVPRLISLLLDNTNSPAGEGCRTPLLQRMPDLVGAMVRIDSFLDECDCDDPVACYHVTQDDHLDTYDVDSDSDGHEEGSGDYAGQNTIKSVLLEALAQARDLVLIADRPTYIFRKGLRLCPTFSNLKTLVLSQAYRREPADCSVLECMLEHAPFLEKLTLTFKKIPVWEAGKYKVEIKGYPDTKGKSTKISQHLQRVEINFEDVNTIFVNVLNFLGTLNICFETRVTKGR